MSYENTFLNKYLSHHVKILKKLELDFNKIVKISNLIINKSRKNKIFIIGNGGSAAESDHFCTELMIKFKKKRLPISAISLSNNGPLLTAHSNDFNFESVYERQLMALANKNDILIAMSTSGKSKNILRAARYAFTNDLVVISFTGSKKSLLHKYSNYNISVQSEITSFIQEIHLIVIHTICELIEKNVQ